MITNRCKVKICGTTSLTDAKMAADAGADYSGVVTEVPFSERSVTINQAAILARQTPIPTVILVFDHTTDWVQHAVQVIQPFAVQLLGHETPSQVATLKQSLSCEVWKSLFLPVEDGGNVDMKDTLEQMDAHIHAGADALLFDTVAVDGEKTRFGGTGKTSDWNTVAKIIQASTIPAFLSGGIRPENVKAAIETVRPYGIDLCSGVESTKGIRDLQKLEALMRGVIPMKRTLGVDGGAAHKT